MIWALVVLLTMIGVFVIVAAILAALIFYDAWRWHRTRERARAA